MKRWLSMIMAGLIAFGFSVPGTAAAYEAAGSQLYAADSETFDELDAIALNLLEYFAKLGEGVVTELDGDTIEALMRGNKLPAAAQIEAVWNTFLASSYAFTDLGNALSDLISVHDQKSEAIRDLAIQLQIGQQGAIDAAYRLGKSDRGTANSVPEEKLALLRSLLNHRPLLNQHISTIENHANSWIITLFHSKLRKELLRYTASIKAVMDDSDIVDETYNLARYGTAVRPETPPVQPAEPVQPLQPAPPAQPTQPAQSDAQRFENQAVYLTFKGTSINVNIRAENDAGADRNGVTVNSWPHTGHSTQQFRIDPVGDGKVRLRLLSSAGGYGRVIDVKRDGKPIVSGMKLQVFDANDPPAQHFYMKASNGYFYFVLASNPDLAITSAEVKKDGPQLTISPFRGLDSQLFAVQAVNGNVGAPNNETSKEEIKAVYDRLVANGLNRDYSQYTKFQDWYEGSAYVNCTYLTYGRIKEKTGYAYQFTQDYDLNGNRWHKYSPDSAKRQQKFGTIEDAVRAYGPVVENVVVSFEKSYGTTPEERQYGHVLLLEAIIDGVVYYSDIVNPQRMERKSIADFLREYNKLYSNVAGVVKIV